MSNVPNVLNRSRPDDPRLLQSESFRAVHFVFGLFHPQVPPLSGHALLGALGTLGFGDEAARGILLRLRRGGFLESRRSGRQSVYALSPRSIRLLGEIARRSTEPPPPWDFSFETLVIQIPADDRAFREQLRRQAAYAGFGTPLPGLLIAPYAASTQTLDPLLARAPRGVKLTRCRLAVNAADAARMAASAWDLGARAADLRREADRMLRAAAAAEARPPDGPDALRLLWTSIGPFFELLSASAPLPTALLPADWPLDAARAAFVRLALTLAEPARLHVAGHLSTS
jgi:phenylacetic acid degradation operon negative regulatory protein